MYRHIPPSNRIPHNRTVIHKSLITKRLLAAHSIKTRKKNCYTNTKSLSRIQRKHFVLVLNIYKNDCTPKSLRRHAQHAIKTRVDLPNILIPMPLFQLRQLKKAKMTSQRRTTTTKKRSNNKYFPNNECQSSSYFRSTLLSKIAARISAQLPHRGGGQHTRFVKEISAKKRTTCMLCGIISIKIDRPLMQTQQRGIVAMCVYIMSATNI